MNDRIRTLLEDMTLEEKVSLLAGADTWTTVPIERLGIPAIKVTDGPNGARGAGDITGGVPAACFPVGIALASTWNTGLVERVGRALGQEVRSKGAHILLAPTVNIHRSPLNGRNFECYSEDPYLTARLAVAYINGVQSEHVGATIKHFVCNDSEFERNSISSEVAERPLREIYLPPFEAAVREAKVWAVMSAYNRVNGTYAGEHARLLLDILRAEWGFDGIVISDWFGTRSTAAAANNGLDLEMPGPTQWRGRQLVEAVRTGAVSAETIDARAARVLSIIERAGAFENPVLQPEQAIDRPEHRAIIREAGQEAIVLLKNDRGMLPLDAGKIRSLAVIGPNARVARIMGGGSSQVQAHYAISPYEGIVSRVGSGVAVGYEIGCVNHKTIPLVEAAWLEPAGGGGQGLKVEYFNSPEPVGTSVGTQILKNLNRFWMGQPLPGVQETFSARLTGKLNPPESGVYTFGLSSAGLSRLYVDGRLVLDNWTSQQPGDSFYGMGSTEITAPVMLEAGQPVDLRLEFSRRESVVAAGFRLGCLPPVPADALDRAAALAARSDAAVVFVGLNGDWDSEGYDRPDLELVGDQVALIEKVAAANPNTVIVLQSGAPLVMRWLDKVPAVLQAWYLGQECGNAIADVLFGDVCPSGRLPQTFPVRLEDNPAYINYPGENGRVTYGEGIFVGYRYYDRKKIAPLFPFGYGLSYTRFTYANLRLSAAEMAPGDTLQVSVDVTNTGDRAGKEVVQLYVRDVQARLTRPEKELKGFAKVALAPGETRTVTLPLTRKELAYYDDRRAEWVAEAGVFDILVGASAADIRLRASFTLTETAGFDGPPGVAARRPMTLDTPMSDLLADEGARAVLSHHVPGMLESSQLVGMAIAFSLRQLASFAPDVLTDEVLAAIGADLAGL